MCERAPGRGLLGRAVDGAEESVAFCNSTIIKSHIAGDRRLICEIEYMTALKILKTFHEMKVEYRNLIVISKNFGPIVL